MMKLSNQNVNYCALKELVLDLMVGCRLVVLEAGLCLLDFELVG